ncbi:hypothetical protein CORC01_04349 [Colletotrichum orchidophilum]|uniref:Uncharacterized protein n=1 Tax=Colletotrichum orchidophilum TaxID=1209926 RepID=A0A1G4BG86_9PEZI|nr:uncharacterized protein CORC01_04349 [Colletotrichum orchidophilum]OHF00368.1 hypothetical protein CORC01_04349 [Colletotrichum orchidophilum]
MRCFPSSFSPGANDAISRVADGGPGSWRGLLGRCMFAGQGKLAGSGAVDRHSGYERERTDLLVSPAKRSEFANPVYEAHCSTGPRERERSEGMPHSSEARPVQGLVEGWPAGIHSRIEFF